MQIPLPYAHPGCVLFDECHTRCSTHPVIVRPHSLHQAQQSILQVFQKLDGQINVTSWCGTGSHTRTGNACRRMQQFMGRYDVHPNWFHPPRHAGGDNVTFLTALHSKTPHDQGLTWCEVDAESRTVSCGSGLLIWELKSILAQSSLTLSSWPILQV